MRRRPLYDTAVLAAADELLDELSRLGIILPFNPKISRQERARDLVSATVRAYLNAAEPHKRAKRDWADTTKQLAAMTEGQTITFGLTPLQSLRERMISARTLMQNPAARWCLETRPEGILCTRIEDNGTTHYRDPAKNAKVRELSRMKPGESKIAVTIKSTRSKGQMGSNTKIMARKLMGEPNADWSVKMTNHGVRITRVR